MIKELNILYAEDDKYIREKIESILRILFANVFVAPNGARALELYSKNRIDIVLLDYVMPIMDGYDVSKMIREQDKTVPIIISSGFTDKDKLLKIIELNYIQFIEKPIMFDELNTAISKALDILAETNKLVAKLADNLQYSYIKKSIYKQNTDTLSEEIPLSKKEVLLVELLLSKRNQLFTKSAIEERVFMTSVDENTMRNLVYRLRKKIGIDFIITIKDLGYMIKE